VKNIYRITYPNGKIYVGKGFTNTINYFESASSVLIEKDFSNEERRDVTIRKEVFWESEIASNKEGNLKEVEYIRFFKSNDSCIVFSY